MKSLKIFSLLLVAGVLFSCQSEKTVKKDIALQLYSLRDDIKTDFKGTIAAIGEMGFTSIEAANYGDGKFYNMAPADFKAAIEGAGMKVLSSHVGKSLPEVAPDSIPWPEIWAWWDTCIIAHKAAGMSYIVTPSMPKPKTLQGLQVYCDYYNKIGEKCKEKGMKFGYHNHDFEFEKIEGQTMYNYMLEHTNPDLVCFEMDVYWVVRGGQSPVDYFKDYPGRFELLHIKDNKELGQSGMVGFDAIFNHIDEDGSAGTKHIIVEVEKYNFGPRESVKKSYDYLVRAPFVKASYDVPAKETQK